MPPSDYGWHGTPAARRSTSSSRLLKSKVLTSAWCNGHLSMGANFRRWFSRIVSHASLSSSITALCSKPALEIPKARPPTPANNYQNRQFFSAYDIKSTDELSTDYSSFGFAFEFPSMAFHQLRYQFAYRSPSALVLRPMKCYGPKELPRRLRYVNSRSDAPMSRAVPRFRPIGLRFLEYGRAGLSFRHKADD